MRHFLGRSHERQTCKSTQLLAALLLVATLGGCAFARGTGGDEFGEETIKAFESIQKGVTTRAEVTANLGAPDETVAAAGREIYHSRRYDGMPGQS